MKYVPRLALLTCLLALTSACGGEPPLRASAGEAEAAAIASGVVTAGTITPAGVLVWDDDPAVEVRINHDAAAITEDVLPALSDDFGLDAMSFSNRTLKSGTAGSLLSAVALCHTTSAHWHLKLKDVEVAAGLRSTSFVTRFDSGRRVFGDLDLPSFSAEGKLEFSWPRDVGGWYCDTFGSDYVLAVNVDITGVDGTLDVTLAETGGLSIASIDAFELDVNSVAFDSSLLTWITNVGLSVADMFGASCGSLTACVNDAIDDDFTSRSDIKEALRDAVASALSSASTLRGALNFGVGSLDYAVSFASLTTNDDKDRLRTKWDVDFTSRDSDSSCASGLTRAHYAAVNDLQTDDDLELVVPFKKVSDLLYTVAKQGDLCAPFLYTSGTTVIGVQVKPTGAFQVTPTGGDSVSVTLPIAVEATVAANATSAITGTLTITTRVQPACGGGFQLVPQSVTLGSLTGTMTYVLPTGQKITMSATSFIASKKAAAEAAILAALSPGLSLVPSSFGLGAVSKWVSIGDVAYDATAMTIGLNLLGRDPYCP